MQNNLKLYHKLLPLLIIPICLFLFVTYGWSAFATLTERNGLYGDMYSYYKLTIFQFSFYTGLVSLLGLSFILLLIDSIIKSNPSKLTKLFWSFLIFVILIIICEFYLQTRFTGKG